MNDIGRREICREFSRLNKFKAWKEFGPALRDKHAPLEKLESFRIKLHAWRRKFRMT